MIKAAAKNTAWMGRWRPNQLGIDLYEVVLTVPLKTVSETNMREHPMARHRRRKKQRETVRLLAGIMLRVECLTLPCIVTFTRVAPSTGLDDDNLRGAMKAIRDGLADAFRVNDRDPRIEWRYDQRRGPPKRYAVEIEVRPAERVAA